MSIIPASRLSSSDLALLGNNTDPANRRPLPQSEREARRAQLAAVNRSLGRIGEQVSRLHRPLLAMPQSLAP
jgi:hypothetical protein